MNEIPEELQERIAAYIDGQLPPAEAARLEVFLANTDRQLADQVIGMIADRNRMNLMPKPRAPRDLAARIMDQVERTTLLHDVEHLSGGHRRWWQSRAAIAAGVAIMLGGFTYVIIQQVWRTADHPWQQLVDGRPVGPAAVGGRAVEDRDEHAKGIAEVGAMKSMAKGDEGLMSNRDKVADTQNIGRADGVIASAGAAGQSMARDAGATREGVTAMAEGVNGPVQTVPPTQSAAMQVAVAPPATTFAAPAMAAASTKPAETQLASAGGMADPVPTLRGAGGGGGGGRGGAAGRGGRGGGGGGGGAGGAGAGGLGGGAGGAGGGGFGGGGGGRRGGAGGPGGGTGAMAVAPNSAMASELKQIDAADRALKALATLTGSGSDPLVVSLVARDNLDYTKLRSFIAQANGNDYNGKMMANGGQQAPNNFDNNRAQTGGSNTTGGQFGMNNGITGGITGNSTTQFNDLSVRNSNNDRQLGNGMNNLREESAAFRVMLRPDQLETLAKDYRVVVLARGKEVHLLGTIGDKTPPTADASTRDELLRRAGFVTQVANSQPQAEQTRVAQNVAATPPTPPPAAQQVQSKEPQQPLMVTQDRANSTLIDCLITMESAPLTATAPASGAPAATSPVNR